MSEFDPTRIGSDTCGRWLVRPKDRTPLVGVGIDTRVDLHRRAFIAIRGERHDGHEHLHDAVSAGARVLVVEHDVPTDRPFGVGVLLVDETRRALRRLAMAHRRRLAGTVIAITGSSGKTTTKAMLDTVLRRTLRGSAAPHSFNNEIGVPLSLLDAESDDDYVIVEIGTNTPGEVAALGGLARPDIAVITCVGRSHLAGLGSREMVAVEKASLLGQMVEGGIGVLNAEAITPPDLIPEGLHVVRFGEGDDADVRLTDRGGDGSSWWVELDHSDRFACGLPGRHNAMNAVAVIIVARRLGLDDATISAGLAEAETPPMRMSLETHAGIRFLNDAYNANPDSVAAALDSFVELAAGANRRIVVLGDMLELGAAGPELHRETGERVAATHARLPIERAIFVGPLSAHAAEAAAAAGLGPDRVRHVPSLNPTTLCDIVSLLKPGDTVLIKASRGMALERILDHLKVPAPG